MYTKKKIKLILVICLMLLITGACSSTITPNTPQPIIPTSTNISAQTRVPITLTPSSTITASPVTRPAGLVTTIPSCTEMKVQNVISADYQVSGVMLSLDRPYYSSSTGRGEYKESSLYHFDLSTRVENFLIKPEDYQEKVKSKIIRLGVEDLSVSPDYLKAIYIVDAYVSSDWEVRKSWLEIYDSVTKERKRIPWKDEWDYIIGWINTDYFAIRSGGSVLFLNNLGSVKKQLLARYPDYSNPRVYNPDAFVLWGGYRKFGRYSFDSFGGNLASVFWYPRDMTRLNNPTLEVYSPSLEYVIYTEVKDRKPGIVLYDIKAKGKLIEIITDDKVEPIAFGGAPVWSPSGDSALMLLPVKGNPLTQAIFQLHINGQVEQLTDSGVLGPYSWSPDGKYIAFWLANGKQIGILNMDNKELKVFCLDGGYSNGGPDNLDRLFASGDLVWLPNDKQILMEVFKASGDIQYEGIGIADLEQALFIELKWNARFPVWLAH